MNILEMIMKNNSKIQSPALLVDSEPQLWTARVSSTKQDAVYAGMNTVQVLTPCLKGERTSYQKIALFLSGIAYKKIQKITNSKMTLFFDFPEICPSSGQSILSFIIFHVIYVWQSDRNYLDMF
jgi:hypothetical protein